MNNCKFIVVPPSLDTVKPPADTESHMDAWLSRVTTGGQWDYYGRGNPPLAPGAVRHLRIYRITEGSMETFGNLDAGECGRNFYSLTLSSSTHSSRLCSERHLRNTRLHNTMRPRTYLHAPPRCLPAGAGGCTTSHSMVIPDELTVMRLRRRVLEFCVGRVVVILR
jgi:hypothetical protein